MTNSTSVGRGRLRARRALLALTSILATGGIAPAAAQTAREFRQIDENGVDLVYGDFVLSFTEGSIGSGDGELAIIRRNGEPREASQWDGLELWRTVDGPTVTIKVGRGTGLADTFTGGLTTGFSATLEDGATLTGGGDVYLYTASDGTVTTYADPTGGGPTNQGDPGSNFCSEIARVQASCLLLPIAISKPNGQTMALDWDTHGYAASTAAPYDVVYFWRLAKVSNNRGYSITFNYAGAVSGNVVPSAAWFTRTGADFRNAAVGTAAQGSVGYAYPATGTVDVTDMAGKVWRVTATSIRRPGESTPALAANSSTAVTSVTRDGVTTGYARSVSVSGTTATMVVTNGLNEATTIMSNLVIGRPTAVTDALNKTTYYGYDGEGRLTAVTAPEGNTVTLTRDTRGRVTDTVATPKTGTGSIATHASYPSTCSYAATCYLPETTTDALGRTTNFVYYSHGGIKSVTRPAATTAVGEARPETRYGYDLVNGEQRLKTVSACAINEEIATSTRPSCIDTADETRTTIGYDANGNADSVTTAAGDASVSATAPSATVTSTWTALGDVATVNGPLSGADDTVGYRYDAARRRIGVIGADPDGTGTRKRRAERTTYDDAGRPTLVETGVVTGLGDTAWDGFVSSEATGMGYDPNGRMTSRVVGGAATYAVTAMKYDALGRIRCVAQRMNGPNWGATLDPCIPDTTGSQGPDRITRASYDEVGRQVKLEAGVLTDAAADVWRATYTDNGRLASLTDGENNKTTYTYDRYDRPLSAYFPVLTKGAGLSATGAYGLDYEELGYDDAGNVTSVRQRDGVSIEYRYDRLNRLMSTDLPPGDIDRDITYAYDLLDRPLSATDAIGHVRSYQYDALGRAVSEGGTWSTKTMLYDDAGRRTQLKWQDGFQVDYDRDASGAVTAIVENRTPSSSGTTLVTYGYDDLGRRTSITRGNGTVIGYGYDGASRLNELLSDSVSTTHDQQVLFGHTPSFQIASRTSSNDLYAWTGHANVAKTLVHDGRNRLAADGTATLTHDAKGNVTAIGGTGYAYSARNLQYAIPGGFLTYGPLGELDYISGNTLNPDATLLDYSGQELTTEYAPGGAILKRYVHGDGVDEPLVEYDSSGNRTWLHADERGSVVARSDASGAVTAINRYDDYGLPAAGNVGRFQYTGQAWLPELGMYYYKARMYAPTLGRFIQADPIGYEGGMNLYAYVGGDPVNFTDPRGLKADTGIPYCTLDIQVTCTPRPGTNGGDSGFGWTTVCSGNCGSFYFPDFDQSSRYQNNYISGTGELKRTFDVLTSPENYWQALKRARCSIGKNGQKLQTFASTGSTRALAFSAFSMAVPNPFTEAASVVYGTVYGGLGLIGAGMEAVGGQFAPLTANIVMNKATSSRPAGAAFGSVGGEFLSMNLEPPTCKNGD